MANDSGDVLMMLCEQEGTGISADAKTILNSADDLVDDFVRGKFFEITDFDLGVKLRDLDSSDESEKAPANETEEEKKKRKEREKKAKKKSDKYKEFMSGGSIGDYLTELDEIWFERQMDSASSAIFKNCINKTGYATAAIVKRKDVGDKNGLVSYIRVDFSGVLITGIDWDNGEIVKEKCTFVCRQVVVQYKRQLSDGTLGPAVPGYWKTPVQPGDAS